MKLRDKALSFFRKSNSNSFNIINASSIITIPNREQLIDKKIILLLDQYKCEYSKILARNKHLVSIDLTIDRLYENMFMYLELLLNNCYKDKDNLNIDYQYDLENNMSKIDALIKYTKLTNYEIAIDNMEKEVLAKLIALNELLHERKYIFSPNKKNCVASEINKLSIIRSNFESQKIAIRLEVEAYKNYLSLSFNISLSELEQKELSDRKNILQELAKAFIFDKIEELHKLELSDIAEVALLEKELEIFVYTHKEEIKKAQEEIIVLSKEEITKDKQDIMLNRVIYLEKLYQVFSMFGRNLVSKEQFYDLYQLKFNLLTFDLIHSNAMPFHESMEEIELECYKEIIMKKIECLVNGSNAYIYESFLWNSLKAISILKMIFKDENRQFDSKKILTNHLLLSLLLALDKKDGLDEFFNNYLVLKANYPNLDFYEDVFSWKDELPLATIFWLMNNQGVSDSLSILYNMTKKTLDNDQNSNIYRFPEGLVAIDYNFLSDKPQKTQFILDKIRKDVKNKSVILPSTLVTLLGNIFSCIPLLNIELNFGLESIFGIDFDELMVEKLILPPSVSNLDFLADINKHIKELIFYDYKNSKILNNETNLLELLKSFFCILKKRENSDNSTIIEEYCDLYSNLDSIVFLDENKNECARLYIKNMLKIYSSLYDWEHLGYVVFINKINDLILQKQDESEITSRKLLL